MKKKKHYKYCVYIILSLIIKIPLQKYLRLINLSTTNITTTNKIFNFY